MAEVKTESREEMLKTESYEHRNKNVLFIKRTIKNNLLTIPVAIVAYLLITLYYMYDIFRLCYDVAFNTNVNSYYYEVSGSFPEWFGGQAEAILNAITGYMIKFVRMVLLIMFICIFIYLCCYAVLNVFIQHEIKIPYVMLVNVLSLLITISIVYYVMPSTTELIITFAGYLQDSYVYYQEGSYIDIPEPFSELLKVMITPLIIAVVLMFVLSTTLQILLKYAKKW
jgi:hypothetical protein